MGVSDLVVGMGGCFHWSYGELDINAKIGGEYHLVDMFK